VRKREILVFPRMSQLELEEMMMDWARKEDVQIRPMGRLVRRYKTKGEDMHWHIAGLKKGMGTIEVSYAPSDGRLSVLVHDNRRGFWAGQAYLRLVRAIAESPRTREVFDPERK